MKKAASWVWHEFKEMLPAAGFFLLTFHLISLTKSVILSSHGLSAVKASTATVAALLVAKAILVVDSLPFARLFSHVIWHNVVWRIFLFYLVTALFHLLENMANYYLQAGVQSFDVNAIAEWVSWQYFAVTQMWLIILLTLFTLLREIIQLIGHDQIVRLITQKRPL